MYACIHSPPNFSPIQTGNRPPSRWGQVRRLAWLARDAVEHQVRKLIYLGSRQPLLRWHWNQLSLITWTRALGLVSSCPAFSSSPCGFLDFTGGTCGKEPTCQCRRHQRCRFNPGVGKIPWRRAWQPISVFLPGESHGQRNVAGYSPWGCKVSDTTENTWVGFSCLPFTSGDLHVSLIDVCR